MMTEIMCVTCKKWGCTTWDDKPIPCECELVFCGCDLECCCDCHKEGWDGDDA